MAIQTTYSDNIRAALPGMVADMTKSDIVSRTVKDAAGIGFGLAVTRAAADREISAFSSGDTTIYGVTVRDQSVASGTDEYAQYDSAAVLIKGPIWVTASVSVNNGDPVYVIPATGAFTKTSASSAVLITGATWETTTSGAAIAMIFIK